MKKEFVFIIVSCFVIAILASLITTSITGNAVKVGLFNKKQVYTTQEVDDIVSPIQTKMFSIESNCYTKSEVNALISSINTTKYYSKKEIDKLFSTARLINDDFTNQNCNVVCKEHGNESSPIVDKCLFGQISTNQIDNDKLIPIWINIGCTEIPEEIMNGVRTTDKVLHCLCGTTKLEPYDY